MTENQSSDEARLQKRTEQTDIPELQKADHDGERISDTAYIKEMLNLIFSRMAIGEGKVPNFVCFEFALTQGSRYTVKADFRPDRWAVWFTDATGAELRVYPGDYCPNSNSILLENQRHCVVGHHNEALSFYNPGSADIDSVFAVAIGGGSEFQLLS
jgi:hypothetical protein